MSDRRIAMARKATKATKAPKKASAATRQDGKALQFRPISAKGPESEVHVFGNKVVCDTEPRGHATPRGRSPLEIVVDASEGFIPLWAKDTTLRWQFRESSMRAFSNPTAAKAAIRRLFGEALLAWGNAAPVKFAERSDAWDFEIVMRRNDNCDANGCVLASAFFPDGGRHQLVLYPKMFAQSRQEQLETLVHEIGHTFGLRHFFANISETDFPSEIFGVHRPFSVMNYGDESRLTDDDRRDLRRLYQLAWSGQLTQINGTPIKFVRPFHTIGAPPQTLVTMAPAQPAQPLPRAAYTDVVVGA
jgi:hypothetical protein